MRLVFLILLLGSALPCLAQQKAPTCQNGDKLPNICMAIGTASTDNTARYQFTYQRIISDAACVTPEDSEEEAGRKIREMWTQYEDKLICNNTRFDVQNGSMLKFAASARFEDFLFDASMIWKVNLNRVDPSDGRTVLDYVQKEIERNRGTSIESKLESYYDMLRTAGAKHRSEL
jgi:hypothetical protein